MLHKRVSLLLALLVVFSMVLSACGTPEPSTPAAPTEDVTEGEEPTSAPATEEEIEVTPEEEDEPTTLVVCLGQEPDSLYQFGSTMAASSHVQEAIYDGAGGYGYDTRTYSYQPVILEKLPSINDDDAVIQEVTVQEGDLVVDNMGEPVELIEGVMVRPSGCTSSDCAVEFDGEPIEMAQMVVTFKIKEGVAWSDGTSVTADDSLYGFELRANPDTPMSRYTVERTASYEATDERTNVWTGLPGYFDSVYFLNFYNPLPRHLWEEELGYTALDLLEAEESSRLPMGYGPYVINEWVSGDHMTLEKNPYYFRADEGLPYVDTLIYRFVPDANAAVAQMLSGECDIVTPDASLEDQAEFLIQLEEQNQLIPHFVAGAIWEHMDFAINYHYDRPDYFEDVRVRQAFAHCLDRQTVVDTILFGRSVIMDSYLPADHPMYAGDRLTSYAYDPEAGMALLEEAGWVDEDGDGIREAQGIEGIEDGTPLSVVWESTTASMRVDYMQLFQQDLMECGIDITIRNIPSTEFFASAPEGPLYSHRFDLGSFAWISDPDPGCYLYLSNQIPLEENGWNGQNVPAFINEEYDRECTRAMQALPDTEDYVEGHLEAQRIFSEQLPTVPLFQRFKLAASRPEVKGFIVDPTQQSVMWNIEAIDLKYE